MVETKNMHDQQVQLGGGRGGHRHDEPAGHPGQGSPAPQAPAKPEGLNVTPLNLNLGMFTLYTKSPSWD